jgi:hypothetical protein
LGAFINLPELLSAIQKGMKQMEAGKPKKSRLSEAGIQVIFEMMDRAKAKGPSYPDQKIQAPKPPHQKPNTPAPEED